MAAQQIPGQKGKSVVGAALVALGLLIQCGMLDGSAVRAGRFLGSVTAKGQEFASSGVWQVLQISAFDQRQPASHSLLLTKVTDSRAQECRMGSRFAPQLARYGCRTISWIRSKYADAKTLLFLSTLAPVTHHASAKSCRGSTCIQARSEWLA